MTLDREFTPRFTAGQVATGSTVKGEVPSHEVMEAAAEWYALLISDEAGKQDRKRWQDWLTASDEHRQAWSYVERGSASACWSH